MPRSRSPLCLLIAALFLLVACGGSTAENALDRVKEAGVLRIAYANEPPYGYLDSATDRVTGEAPEIARHIAAELGIDRVEGVLVDWGNLIPGLQSGRFDCIAAGMYINAERAEAVLFTNPTYAIGEAFLVQSDNPKNLHSYADVADGTAVLGVVKGTVEIGYAEKTGIPSERVIVFDSNLDAVKGVQTGRVDAFAGTYFTVLDLIGKLGPESNLALADPFTDPVIDGKPVRGYGAFAFRQSDPALRDAFNKVLADFMGTPAHLELVAPFGFGPATLPGTVTADDVIAGNMP